MAKSLLVVSREKLLEKFKCSNGNGDPSRGSTVAISMEKGEEKGRRDPTSEVLEAINEQLMGLQRSL